MLSNLYQTFFFAVITLSNSRIYGECGLIERVNSFWLLLPRSVPFLAASAQPDRHPQPSGGFNPFAIPEPSLELRGATSGAGFRNPGLATDGAQMMVTVVPSPYRNHESRSATTSPRYSPRSPTAAQKLVHGCYNALSSWFSSVISYFSSVRFLGSPRYMCEVGRTEAQSVVIDAKTEVIVSSHRSRTRPRLHRSHPPN